MYFFCWDSGWGRFFFFFFFEKKITLGGKILRCVLLGIFGFCIYMAIQNGFGEEQRWRNGDGMMGFAGRFLSKMQAVAFCISAFYCQCNQVGVAERYWVADATLT